MSRATYVRSDATGAWMVYRDDFGRVLSTHDSETAAERAAEEHAARHGGAVVMVDRYERVHECHPAAPAAPSES